MQTNTQRHEEPPSFVAANPRRLMPSQAIIEEYALGAGPRNKRGYLADCRDAVGYVFPWGHVIEAPPGPEPRDDDESHPICSWDFCLDEALADHHNAGLSLNDLSELVGTDFQREGLTTVGGLVYKAFGRVPRAGEYTRIDGFRIVVERVRRRRVERVYIERDADAGATR